MNCLFVFIQFTLALSQYLFIGILKLYIMVETKNAFEKSNVKPFLKWAGGKTQILPELEKRLPSIINDTGIIENYVEPFVGGGALFFHLYNRYDIKKSVLIDINRELIVGYKVIKKDHKKLINSLKILKEEYLSLDKEKRKEFFYEIRKCYNEQMNYFDYKKYASNEWVERAKYLIFLNRTCYNGLFRQNEKGEFNVPSGAYKNPPICDDNNIQNVSKALKNTIVLCGDFTLAGKHIQDKCFVYMDPPYRPLTSTSNFTAYTKNGFDDSEQIRLANFYKSIDKKGVYLLLSNSDPKNVEINDDFFDSLYSNYKIERILARRMINCNGSGRGTISELIIRNY